MARVKRAAISRVRKNRLYKRVKGFFLGRKRLRQAMEARMKAETNEFIGRKQRKRQFRALWITRLNADGSIDTTFQNGLPDDLQASGAQAVLTGRATLFGAMAGRASASQPMSPRGASTSTWQGSYTIRTNWPTRMRVPSASRLTSSTICCALCASTRSPHTGQCGMPTRAYSRRM